MGINKVKVKVASVQEKSSKKENDSQKIDLTGTKSVSNPKIASVNDTEISDVIEEKK